jgi:hypothetical protein
VCDGGELSGREGFEDARGRRRGGSRIHTSQAVSSEEILCEKHEL